MPEVRSETEKTEGKQIATKTQPDCDVDVLVRRIDSILIFYYIIPASHIHNTELRLCHIPMKR